MFHRGGFAAYLHCDGAGRSRVGWQPLAGAFQATRLSFHDAELIRTYSEKEVFSVYSISSDSGVFERPKIYTRTRGAGGALRAATRTADYRNPIINRPALITLARGMARS